MSGYYPVMMRIEGKRCVVIGGGAVAQRKVEGLLDAGADVLVVSPAWSRRLGELAEEGRIRAERRPYREGDLTGAALAFAATDSRDVNAAVTAEAEAAGIPVDTADAGGSGTFLSPAVVRRGGLVIAVSASGASPGLAARVASELGERYGPEWEAYVRWLRRLRSRGNSMVADPETRRRLLLAAIDVPETEWSADVEEDDIDRRVSTLLAQLSGGMTDESGAEAADDCGRDKAERARADADGPSG